MDFLKVSIKYCIKQKFSGLYNFLYDVDIKAKNFDVMDEFSVITLRSSVENE